MTDIIPAPNRRIRVYCFTHSSEECPSAQNAHATDMAFILSRSFHKPMPSWTFYNQNVTTVNPEKTTVGYIPIIQARVTELNTLNTCSQIDRRATCRSDVGRGTLSVAAEIKWSEEEYKDITLPWRTFWV